MIYLLLSFPLLWGLLVIVIVFLSLSFQVFALEEEKSAFDAIKTGINHVKFNFLKTTLLLIVLGIFTYWLIPGLINWGFEMGNILGIFSFPVEQYVKLFPLNDFNEILAEAHIPIVLKSYDISKQIVLSFIAMIVTGFALPLRSICCTSLYKEIHKRNYAGKIAAEKLANRAGSSAKRKNSEDDDD